MTTPAVSRALRAPRPARAVTDLTGERAQLVDAAHDLVREFEGYLPAGAVLRCMTRCRNELLLAGVRAGLPDAAADLARARLRDRLAL